MHAKKPTLTCIGVAHLVVTGCRVLCSVTSTNVTTATTVRTAACLSRKTACSTESLKPSEKTPELAACQNILQQTNPQLDNHVQTVVGNQIVCSNDVSTSSKRTCSALAGLPSNSLFRQLLVNVLHSGMCGSQWLVRASTATSTCLACAVSLLAWGLQPWNNSRTQAAESQA